MAALARLELSLIPPHHGHASFRPGRPLPARPSERPTKRGSGITAQYRHEDLRRLKKQLDEIPHTAPENVVQLKVAANQ